MASVPEQPRRQSDSPTLARLMPAGVPASPPSPPPAHPPLLHAACVQGRRRYQSKPRRMPDSPSLARRAPAGAPASPPPPPPAHPPPLHAPCVQGPHRPGQSRPGGQYNSPTLARWIPAGAPASLPSPPRARPPLPRAGDCLHRGMLRPAACSRVSQLVRKQDALAPPREPRERPCAQPLQRGTSRRGWAAHPAVRRPRSAAAAAAAARPPCLPRARTCALVAVESRYTASGPLPPTNAAAGSPPAALGSLRAAAPAGTPPRAPAGQEAAPTTRSRAQRSSSRSAAEEEPLVLHLFGARRRRLGTMCARRRERSDRPLVVDVAVSGREWVAALWAEAGRDGSEAGLAEAVPVAALVPLARRRVQAHRALQLLGCCHGLEKYRRLGDCTAALADAADGSTQQE
eukprot:CAMPEP_0183336806 /NCGR_PEP_ID=MMETSP0164_2-20130417/4667_1 /TAXON_ID=221442 /ORGANISM="Coccolithus pelagicus ssp braarudi, Strain PLY182g" /LENGTH=401 /DNA_ID=CAMNT_0025506401 /DNA_START=498 /DNA_END=1705 /DNA_ORIENTATION=+